MTTPASTALVDKIARRLAEVDPPTPALRPVPPHVDPETGEKVGPVEGSPASGEAPRNLPDDFWNARPELAHVRQAAHATGRSADAVLGATLARIAALTPPTLRLPAPVGTPGTLDVAIAIVGTAGGGKSTSSDVAATLVAIDDPAVITAPMGSGEGLIEAYMGLVDEVGDDGKTHKVKRQVHRAVLAMLDEGQALAEIGGRKGSTLMPTIRTAWSGGMLGQANASEDRKRYLPAGGYRFVLVAGFQPEYATDLLNDAAGGTPQRFAFFAVDDPTIPLREHVEHPGPLDWSLPVHQSGPMPLDPEVYAEIRTAGILVARGEVQPDPLDAHRNLGRLKMAGLLTVLDRRTNITAEDWRLAGMVMDTSDAVRGSIVAAARARAAAQEDASTARQVRRVVELDRTTEERAFESVVGAMGRHVHRHAGERPGGCVRSCLTTAPAYKHRKGVAIDDAIAEAVARDWIVVDGSAYRPGKSRPS
jgi:hypothetical protein